MKRIMYFLLLATLVAFGTSCGQKNKVNSSQLGTNGSWATGTSPISYPPQTQNALQAFAKNFPCDRKPSLVLNSKQLMGPNTLANSFSYGPLAGDVGTSYVGVNTKTGDLLIVTKVTSQGSLIGFNVEMSYCTGTQYALPNVKERQYISFTAPNGITIYDNAGSSIGRAVAANTIACLGPYQNLVQMGANNCGPQNLDLVTSFQAAW